MTPLTEQEADELVRIAGEYRERAYAPYSKFKVGAALLAESGKIYGGCNVENSSYGLTICAERGAIATAVAAGELKFRAIAVITPTEPVASPCGACRQFMVEFNPLMKVVLANTAGARRICDARELLPDYFTLNG